MGVDVIADGDEPPRMSADSIPLSTSSEDDLTEAAREEDERIELETRVTPALMRIAIVAGLGGLLFGFDTGVVSGALLVIGTALGGERLTTFQEEFLVSSALLGALLGSLSAGKAADRFGRKPIIIFSSVLFILGALEQAAAQVYKEVILGRVLVGIGVGLSSAICPIYLSEASPSKYRGRIVASLVVLITGGQVLAYIVDAIFFHVEKGWRYMFGLGAVPAIAQLLLSFALPESPNHLIANGRIAPARRILKTVYPNSSEAAIQRRIERIEEEVRRKPEIEGERWWDVLKSQEELGKWKDGMLDTMWRDRANRRALMVAIGLQAIQQGSGFNCLMYFSGKILEAAHFANPASFAILVAVTNFLCTIIALRLIDRLGRRPLLLRTLLGMALGMLLLGISFFFIPIKATRTEEGVEATIGPTGPGVAAYFALAAMVVFCSNYALGIGNVAWVVQSEVFSHDIRGIGTSLATATNWTANLIVASSYLHLAQLITPGGAFILFAMVALAGFAFTYAYLPETKGLALSEIKGLFEEGRRSGGDGDVEEGSRVESRYERVHGGNDVDVEE